MMRFSSASVKCAFVFGLLSAFWGGLPAVAQLGLAPLFIEEEAVRGRAQGLITLTNATDSAIRVRVYSEPFTYERDGFTELPEAEEDLSPYLQFSPREVVIEPGADQRVRLLGLFPPGLPAGEYRAAVFAEELNESNEAASSTVVKARVGSTVYMRKGELSAELSGLSVSPADDRQVLELVVGNSGEATARPEVRWQLQTAGAAAAGENAVDVASGRVRAKTVIAEGDRTFPLSLPEAIAPGSYILSGEIRWQTLGEVSVQPFELPVRLP